MQASMLRSVIVAVALLGLPGCIRAYRPPAENEPHALLKLRRLYVETPGPHLDEAVDVGDFRIETRSGVEPSKAPYTKAFRIHLDPVEVVVRSDFYALQTQQVREPYTDYEYYSATESYNCGGYSGYGTSRSYSYRSCTRSVRKSRPVRKYRDVTRTVRVSRGSCAARTYLQPRDRAMYVLQFSFDAPGQCHLKCFEQHAKSGGGEFVAPGLRPSPTNLSPDSPADTDEFALEPCGGRARP